MPLGGYGRFAAATGVIVVVLGLAACSGSGSDPKPTTPRTSVSLAPPISASTTVPPTTSAPTRTPEEQAAVTAYLNFVHATNAAELEPKNAKLTALSAFAVDPALGQAADLISQLQVFKYSYRGTPPRPRVKLVGKQSLEAHVVKLANCPTIAPNWKVYSTTTGKPAKQVANGSAALPPYAISVTVRAIDGKWKVANTAVDATRTCKP